MADEWKRTQITESGNYPKQSFKGVLKAIYPTVTESGIPVLQLDFEDGKTYNMPTSAKDGQYGVHEDGTVDGFMAIGQFIASIEKLDAVHGIPANEGEKTIECFVVFADGQPAGFRTEPDIVGKTLHNVARPRQVPAKEGKPEYPDWTIGAIEGLITQSVKKKGGYPEVRKPGRSAKEQPSPTQTDITGIVLDALPEPRSVSELFTALEKKYKVSELRVALEALKSQGIVVENNGKYQVV